MTHLTQIPSRNDASSTLTAFDARLFSGGQRVLRLAILMVGCPFPLSQTIAIAGLALAVLGFEVTLRVLQRPSLMIGSALGASDLPPKPGRMALHSPDSVGEA
jgi:hypothetical protein